MTSLKIVQVDPIDGTGDLKATYTTNNVMGSTTLISFLQRPNVNSPFVPTTGMIFDNITQTAIIGDKDNLLLFRVNNDGRVEDISYERTLPQTSDTLRLNRRHAYPQHNYDMHFMEFLRERGVDVQQVPVGGAGRIAMQFLRNYIQPTSDKGKSFADLEPISMIFNCQPDWKTWDTDPTEAIASHLDLPKGKTIYDGFLIANASRATLKDMHHKEGYLLAPSRKQIVEMSNFANDFETLSGKSLTSINY